jgi:hypothetical protein
MEEDRGGVSRRQVIVGGGLLAAALAAGIDLSACSSDGSGRDAGTTTSTSTTPAEGADAPTSSGPRALTDHEHAVIEAASARLIPGPHDDPAEAGHPGAREAGVADYIDGLLGAMRDQTPRVYAGGPFSDRAGAEHNDMATFLPLGPAATTAWRTRIAGLIAAYQAGVAALDRAAGGDFTKAATARQDAALAANPNVADLPSGNDGFTDLLFQHAIEGCYAVPEYGGNTGLVGWKEIGFPGDRQPKGFTADEVSRSDGPDPLEPTGIVADVLDLITATAPGAPSPTVVGPVRGR